MHIYLYVGLLGILYTLLTLNVIKGRQSLKSPLGNSNNKKLEASVRAHANFIEYTPFFCILLAFLEGNQFPSLAIHSIGALFFMGRIFHAYGLLIEESYTEDGNLQGSIKPRIIGMILTILCISISSLLLIGLFIGSLI